LSSKSAEARKLPEVKTQRANRNHLLAIMLISGSNGWRREGSEAEERKSQHEHVVQPNCVAEQRGLVAQTLYAIGATLCLIDTYVSMGFIVLVQLSYVIAPWSGARSSR
jgi:hypothetical protein